MRNSNNPFAMLASRAVRGDDGAKAQLRRDLEPEMFRIVCRVVRLGAAQSPLDRRILAEANKLGLNATSIAGVDAEFLLRQVARRVCSIVIDGTTAPTRDPCPMQDTIRG